MADEEQEGEYRAPEEAEAARQFKQNEAQEARTRETEIRANVEFWKSFGVEVDEQEIRKAIESLPEKEGFDWYLAIPKGITMSKLWPKLPRVSEIDPMRVAGAAVAGMNIPTAGDSPKAYYDQASFGFDGIKMPRNAEETYAVAARYSQFPDENSYQKDTRYSSKEVGKAKNAREWEKTGKTYITPLEYMVAEIRWHAENGTLLDDKGLIATICPGSRLDAGRKDKEMFGERVPEFHVTRGSHFNGISLSGELISKMLDQNGVREVVTKDTEVEQDSQAN